MNEKDLYVVGDVRYTENASTLYESGNNKNALEFLFKIQELMEEFGVIKIDVCMDALRIKSHCNNQ